jgi:hypothetical protein
MRALYLGISLVLALVATTGCHGRGRGDGTPTERPTDGFIIVRDGGTSTADAGSSGDGGGGRDGGATRDGGSTSPCDHDGFPRAFSRTRADAEYLQYSAIDNLAGDPTTVLQVQRFYSLGAGPAPEIVALRPESYADCATCILVFLDCRLGATVYDAEACEKIFLARSGTAELTFEGDVGGQLWGMLRNVELAEVTIDPTTFESVEVPGGETWCLPEYVFEDEVIDPIE